MIYLACCIPYSIHVESGSFLSRFQTSPFFAYVEANSSEEAMALGKRLAEKQVPNHGNYAAYVVEESQLSALLPWTWDRVNVLGVSE